MKKILSLVCGLFALLITNAHAGAPKITLGGSMDFQTGYVRDDYFSTGYLPQIIKNETTTFANNARIDVKADGTLENGLRYGTDVRLLADVSAANRNEGFNADRTYIYFESNIGRLELGSNVSATHAMRVNTGDFASGAGGATGDYSLYFPPVNSSVVGPFILRPELPSDSEDSSSTGSTFAATKLANKITYYTPRYQGFQAGISYTPDTLYAGTAASFANDPYNNGSHDNLNLALNYEGQWQDWRLKVSGTTEYHQSQYYASNAYPYAVGTNLEYKGYVIGGSYGFFHQGAAPAPYSYELKRPYFYDIGAGYHDERFGASLTYFASKTGTARYSNAQHSVELLSLGGDYLLAKGITLYAELDRARSYDPFIYETWNRDYIGLSGIRFNF